MGIGDRGEHGVAIAAAVAYKQMERVRASVDAAVFPEGNVAAAVAGHIDDLKHPYIAGWGPAHEAVVVGEAVGAGVLRDGVVDGQVAALADRGNPGPGNRGARPDDDHAGEPVEVCVNEAQTVAASGRHAQSKKIGTISSTVVRPCSQVSAVVA